MRNCFSSIQMPRPVVAPSEYGHKETPRIRASRLFCVDEHHWYIAHSTPPTAQEPLSGNAPMYHIPLTVRMARSFSSVISPISSVGQSAGMVQPVVSGLAASGASLCMS